MKIKHYFYMAMAALVMTNCSQEDELQDIQQESFGTLTATIEGGSSRSAVTDGGIFSWTSGDAISVWNGSSYQQCTYSGTGNSFNNAPNQMSGYAIYPQGSHPNYSGSGLPQVNLNSSYTYGSTNAIMLAKVQGNNKNLSFNHLGGLMRFTIKDIPSGAKTFTFTANSVITGNFQVKEKDGANVIETATATSSNKTVTINFTASSLPNGTGTFYVPLPVGTYNGFKIQIGNASYTSQATNTIKRRTLLLMPTFTCSDTQLVKGENSFKLENAEQEMNVGDNESLVIETPASGTNAQLTLNCTPETNNSTLNISDGQTGASTDSKAKVVVNVTNSKTVSNLNIDAPTLTVELTNGTYDEITAKTATQTLIIKRGVTVKNLKVIGGKVEIESGANVQKQTKLRVLTFENADAKFTSYNLDYAGKDIYTWSDLIDTPQYGGSLTYGDMMSAMYTWYDEGNTELTHVFPEVWGTYCYWSGGHAISNYWGAGYSNEDRNKHIAKYYGEDYVTDNAGNDSMLGWFNLQLMTPIAPHSGSNFAVHFGYSDFFSMSGETLPEISFADGEARVIDHMYVTNTNYTLNQLMCGVGSEAGNTFGGNYTGPTADSWYKITAYGYASWDDEEPTSEAEFYLLNGTTPVLDWEKWDLSKLGAVVRVKFNLSGSEEMSGSYGLTIPAYFAYDDVAVQFEN